MPADVRRHASDTAGAANTIEGALCALFDLQTPSRINSLPMAYCVRGRRGISVDETCQQRRLSLDEVSLVMNSGLFMTGNVRLGYCMSEYRRLAARPGGAVSHERDRRSLWCSPALIADRPARHVTSMLHARHQHRPLS
jgi:hypothetical protein